MYRSNGFDKIVGEDIEIVSRFLIGNILLE